MFWAELREALGDAGLVLSLVIAVAGAAAVMRGAYIRVDQWRARRAQRRAQVDATFEALIRVERELIHLAKRFDLSMAQSDQATATTDRAGNWIDVSRAMARQTGRHADELIGRGWYDAMDELDQGEVVRKYEDAVRDLREFEAVFSWKRPSGELLLIRMAAWYVKPIDGYVVNSKRIDERQYAEERERTNESRRRRGSDIRLPPPPGDESAEEP